MELWIADGHGHGRDEDDEGTSEEVNKSVERYPRDAWMAGSEMHTVAHAASDLGRGAVAGGLLNGCLGLDAVGATNRVEDACLGFQALG